MIRTVWTTNPSGETLVLNLRSSQEDLGLLIFNLTGLGPPKATVNAQGGPNFHGTRVSSVRTDYRNLVLTLAVVGSAVDVEEAAKQLVYKHFPIGQLITFGILTDRKNVYLDAIVESNEFNQFAQVENAVISLYCSNPYFIDITDRIVDIGGDSVNPLFEFPFSNESLSVDLLEFGSVETLPTGYISYGGEVKTGADILLAFTGAVGDVTITNSNGTQEMTLDFADAETYFGSAVQSGDQVFLNTRVGEKSAYFVRGGVWFNMLNGVGIDDDWIDIRPGSNVIIINATSGVANINTTITYQNLYEGV